ncbi:MAG: HEAT repeat domain-containing protein [Aggregatilineales bacterium]
MMITGNALIQKALEELDDPDFNVRKRAIQNLAREKYEPALPKLIKIFYDVDQHERVRAIVARALGKIGTQEAYQALVIVLSSIDPAVLKRQTLFDSESSDTFQLQNTMLSVAITVALNNIGTPEAKRMILLWHSGKLHSKST